MATDIDYIRSYYFEYSKYCEENKLNSGIMNH